MRPEDPMPELAIIATLELESGTRADLLPVLMRHRARCLRDEPGTLAFEVLVPDKEPDRLMLYERYQDRAALDAHMKGASFALAMQEAGPRLKGMTGIRCAPAA
jgi:quinol monooxygenase YgiN